MSGLLSISVAEARGALAVSADLDRLAVVLGTSSLGTGLSPFYLSGDAARAGVGYGDGPDTLCQIIEQRQDSGSSKKYPAAFYTVEDDTVGSFGTIDVTGKTGTSAVTVDVGSEPVGTFDFYMVVVTGAVIGVSGGTFRWSVDGGHTLSNITALGTANTYTFPNTGLTLDFGVGDLDTGDVIKVATKAPAPSTTDVAAAFVALAAASIDFSLIVCEFPANAAMLAVISTGLTVLQGAGKQVTALCRSRIPNAGETDAAWNTAVAAETAAFNDSRIHRRATYCLLTDAMTTRQYLRSDLAQFAADAVRVGRFGWPCCPNDRPTPNVTLADSTGATVGHDEGPRGASTGLSNETLGNREGCQQRLPDPTRREAVFNTVPWVFYASDERIRNLMTRRLCNAIKRVAIAAGTISLGGQLFYVSTGPATGTLTTASRNKAQAAIYQAVRSEFANEIENAEDGAIDSGLVQINSGVTVTGGNLLGVTGTVHPRVGGFVLSIDLTLAVAQ